ncbi:outer membrane protein assembly factor BamA [Desulfuromonas sp. TF]|uniref:outer membrane protein assembly factor BamA n=1 Tax=Desulfuromonas sp. TF TaxID=1232410 RepID=UPI0003F95338|nr:outer membrane protein assembly factor BamA [Desulfuromonas sp. TF]
MYKRVFTALIVAMHLLPGISMAQEYAIGEVVIEGNRRVERSAIRSVISIEAGQTVSDEDIDRDIRAIYKLGRFEDVSAEFEKSDGAGTLIFRLTEYPLIRNIEYSGNDELSTEKLRELVTIRTPEIYSPREVAKSSEAIKKAYIEEGFHAVEISSKIDINDLHEATLTFDVKEGDKVLIRDIRFEGNTVFTDRQLKKVIETKERWFLSWLTGRGTYKQEVLENDLEIIADQYYNDGYVQVKVKQPLVTLREDKQSMDLLIEIEEGEQFQIGEMDVQGDLIRSKEDLLKLVKLTEGDIFNRKQLREDVFTLNDLYADQGYAYVNVSPLTRLDVQQKRINVTFDIEQGIQVVIGRVQISGNTKTRDKVIRREMKLVEGELFSASKVKESRRRINNLGFFEEVNVTTGKGTDEAHMDLDVNVKERPTGTFSVGFGYSSVDGIIGQGSVSQENFLGRALKLNLAGSFGGRSTTYQLGVLDPYFLDKDLALGFDVFKTEREYVDFSKKAVGANIKLGIPLTYDLRTFFLYRYEEKEIFDVDANASFLIRDQVGTSTISSITASLTRNTTDYRLDPSMGSVSEASIEFAGLGGTEKFAKYNIDHRHFFPWKWGTVFSAHGRLGYIQEVGGEDIPLDERFWLGGINTIRGFETREVGPKVRRTTEQIDPVTGKTVTVPTDEFEFIGGEKQAYFNFEYTFPLLKDMGLKGLLFFDAGNAWRKDEDYFSNMRYSVGGGIRWFSPMGPLRLEWGYNLDPEETEKPSQFEFSIGKFF